MSNVNLGTATYTITGNASGATNAANQANNALAQLTKSVHQNWFGLQNLGLAFAALPGAVSAGVGMAVKSAIDWQDSLFLLQRTMGDTDEEVNRVGNSILELARRVPLATTDLAHLAATGAQLGIANDALDTFSETMGLLISSTNLTEANVGDLARVMNVMKIPEDQMESFANTILEVGRNTAATETEIANITRRMSGAAAVAGITTDQLLGIGAAVLSLGPRAEAGGTAFNKTISDMTNAVASGGDELDVFAAVSGKTVDEFVRLFRDDAAQAFTAFITGLVRLKGGSEAAYQALNAVGITEARQTQALLQLASGTLDVGNKQRDLNAILGFTAQAWNNSNALQDIAAAKAKTVSGQLQILKNAIFEAGNSLGKFFLPIIGFAIQRFLDFLAGVSVLPGPIKIVVGSLFLLVTALSGVAAIALLVGPRLLLAYEAFVRLTQGSAAASGALGATGGSAARSVGGVNALTIAIENLTLALMGANRAAIEGIGALFAYTSAAANASRANQVNAVSSVGAAGGLAALGSQASKVGKVAGWVGLALTGLTLVTTLLGNKSRNAAKDQQKASDSLKQSLKAQAEAMKTAQEGLDDGTDSENNFGGATDKANKALRKQIELLTQMADAVNSLVDAEESQQNAILALEDAQDNYQKAVERQQNASEILAEAERKVEIARQDAADAADDLRDKEEAVNNARAIGARRVTDAEIDLADARDRQIDDLENIQELEQHIAELRDGSAQELIRATNALRDAENKLVATHRTVEDAEFNLQRLREDGASARDLADAELAVAEARSSEADASADLTDAQKDLQDLQSGKAVLDAERELAKARRDAIRDAEDLVDKEHDLAEARQMVADDTDYLNAQKEVLEAQNRVADALQAVKDAQQEVHSIQDGKLERELRKAELELEGAIITVAKANVELRREQALANGQTFDAADAAHALAEELGNLSALAPTQESANRLQNFIDTLRNARNIPDMPDDSGGGFSPQSLGLPAMSAIPDYFKDLQNEIDKGAKETKKKSAFSIGGALNGGISGALLGASVASVIPGVGTAVGAIVGGIIGLIVGGFGGSTLWKNVGEPIAHGLGKALDWAKNNKYIKAGVEGIVITLTGQTTEQLGKHFKSFGDTMTRGFKTIFGIADDDLKKFKGMATENQKGIQAEFDKATNNLQTFWSKNGSITQQEATNIIGHVNNMRDKTIAGINEMADKQIERMKYLRDNTTTIGKEEYDAAVAIINQKRNDSIAIETDRTAQIAAKIQELRDKGVTVTSDMVNNIIDQMTSYRDKSIALTEESKTKQEALLEALKVTDTRISKEEKDQIIKDAKEARDTTVQHATDKANEIITQAYKQKQAGVIDEETYRKMVNEARTTKEQTIQHARDTADETIRNAQRLADEIPPKAKTGFKGIEDAANETRGKTRKGGSLDLSDIGEAMVNGLLWKLQIKWPDVTNWLSNAASHLPGFIKGPLGIKSPSRVMGSIGEYIIMGLIKGLEDEQQGLEKKLTEISGMFEENLAKQYVSSFMTDGHSGMFGQAQALQLQAAQSALEQAKSAVSGDTFNLQAITSADPAQIVNEYIWAKRIRLRG